MIHEPVRVGRISLAIGVLSAAIIAFELVLMQILSIVQWYHFASMIISVALLGFGASGTVLTFSAGWLLERFDRALAVLLMATGVAMSVALWCSQLQGIRFDSYLLFTGQSHLWRLLLTYLIFFVPFVLGATAIGLSFVGLSRHIGMLYCANLVGSGAGAVIIVILMWLVFPERLVGVLSLACIITGILFMSGGFLFRMVCPAVSCLIPVLFFLHPPGLHVSEFKDISRALDLPGARIAHEKSSPFGLVQIVSSPAQRYAPGVSLMYTQKIAATDAVFINGDWLGPVASMESAPVMGHTTSAAAYAMARRDRVLFLDAATGTNMFLALDKGSRRITAVEPNVSVMEMLKTSIEALVQLQQDRPKITVLNTNSRAYLASDTNYYDLVVLPGVGSLGGSSGLFALKEQYLLTIEAFSEVWERLGPEGVMIITCWMDYPTRNPLRILATIVGVLEDRGVHDPKDYIAAVRGWATMTFVMKRSPITEDERERIRAFCSQMRFDPAMLADISAEERMRYNRLADDALFTLLDEIVSPDRDRLYESYDFAVYPATDNRPFFSQFIRLQGITNLARLFGTERVPFFELGYVIVLLTLLQVGCAAFVLIVLPLFGIGWRGENRAGVLIYFSSIAVGYMFVEIVLIHRFMLYFANPVYSASAVISVMLICSGTGSYLSTRVNVVDRSLSFILAAIILGILIASVGLSFVVQATLSISGVIRWIAVLITISPLCVIMGFPFPAGIMLVRRKDAGSLPWAWGINGCFSVMSAVLATIIAVEAGFTGVMLSAAGAYGLALLAYLFWFRKPSVA
ncbi:MAG TPA: spermidine synthase-like protein [Deltaproteobacteria bacterium]|nr:spermidine synthase-like protein [Deltaproteobacteria bacterium]